ncbi:MAG: Y-family DNA polymerase [Caulobacteraceae bacterium]
MRRVVSVWLPDWPITVWRRSRTRCASPSAEPQPGVLEAEDQPFALVDRTGRGVVLHAVDRVARDRFGLRPGQSHADARAIAPGLVSASAEPEEERRALKALALWFERFSPLVAVDAGLPEETSCGQEGLLIDMTGGAHLFGGEAALLEEMLRRLEAAGVPARAAMADTPGAAFALARWSGLPTAIAPPGKTREALADLPVEALRLDDDAVRLLARFGLQRIGDLYGLPRAGLARRFRSDLGLALVRRLDQALGAEAEPLKPERPAADYRVWQAFAEPLLEAEGVAWALPALAQALCAQLEQDGQGARQLALDAFRTDGRVVRLAAGLSAPSRTPAHLLRLLKEKGIEALDLGFGADALMLSALVAEPLSGRQGELEGDPRLAGSDAIAGLIDRLQARLGEGAVTRPEGVESHLPERSERRAPAGPAPPPSAPPPLRPRPLLLLDPPEPVEAIAELPDAAPSRFTWRRVGHRVAKAQGPERLSPEWWRPEASLGPRAAQTRDYYAVEDEAGRRYWLFREGLYDRIEGEGELPRWWIQGAWG